MHTKAFNYSDQTSLKRKFCSNLILEIFFAIFLKPEVFYFPVILNMQQIKNNQVILSSSIDQFCLFSQLNVWLVFVGVIKWVMGIIGFSFADGVSN